MARHLSWCLKRTFVLTTRFNARLQPKLAAKTSKPVVDKAHLATPGVSKLGFDAEEEDHRELEMFMEDARRGKRHAVLALMKLLCISEENAAKAVEDYPAYKKLQKKTIYENFQVLREGGMFKSTIKDHKYLLIGTPEEMKTKINLIETLGVNINDAMALFHLNVSTLKTFSIYGKIDATYLPARNKLFYLAEKLNCDISTICHAVSYNAFILTMPPPKLMTITEYVLAAGMAPEHILSDLVLYRYPLESIKKKIELAKSLDIHPIRPWIMRCGERAWQVARIRFAQRQTSINRDITREQLICEVFECDMDIAKCLLKRDDKISTMTFEKFTNNMKLLKAQGYSAEEIIMSPLTVQRSTRTLRKLFDMWNEAGLPKGRLSLFCKTQEDLRRIISVRSAELKKENPS